MKQRITYILVFMIFSMSLAYSLDSFMEMPDNHTDYMYMADMEQHHGDESMDCDHCCHGASHMTGITSQNPPASKSQPDQYLIVYTKQLAAITHTPPTPPPTA